MRLLVITLLCLARLLSAAETAGDGEVDAHVDDWERSISEKITIISLDMWKLHDDLRDERHDKIVQIQGENIRKAIQKLIDDAEESDQKQQKQKANGNSGPMKDSKSTGYSGGDRTKPSLRIWNPQVFRDTHIDLAKPIVGAQETLQGRWAARVAAYFYSIAVDEAEAEISRRSKCQNTVKK